MLGNRFLATALVACLLLFVGRVEAGPNVPQCTAATCDQGEAYSAATARSPVVCADEWGGGETAVIATRTDSGASWNFSVECRAADGGHLGWKFVEEPYGKKCSQRGAGSGGFFLGGHQSSCSAGCRYNAGTITGRLNIGGKTYYQSSGAMPTGEVCTYQQENEDQPVTQDDCTQTGTLTQCVTKEGKHCAVASSGKRFCWTPTEAGTKVSGNEAATKSPEGMGISAPAKNPSNGGEWQQTGNGTASGGGGGGTTNFNITNFTSNFGSQGSGADGSGADGEGNGGSGEGDGEGNGSAGGGATCTQPYVCSGDPIMCSLGQQMWLSRCGDRKGDANGDGVPDVLVGDPPENPDPGEDVSPTRWGINVGTGMLDTENIFGAGSCPVMPSFSIMGQTISPSEFPQWCTLVAVMRAVVLLMGAFVAISLLMGGS